MPNDRELTAYHEAGHALCAVRAGRPVAYATIRPTGDDRRRRVRGIVRYKRTAELDCSSPAEAGTQLITCLAGPMAEAIYQYGPDGIGLRPARGWDCAGYDFEAARHYAGIIRRRYGRRRNDVLAEAASQTRDLLVEHWPTIEAIATALLDPRTFGTLAGCEIKRIIERSHLLGPLAALV